MKYLYKSPLTKATALLAIIGVMLTFACKKPTEGISVLIKSDTLFPAPTVIKFSNADSNSTTPLGNFNVNISGSGAKYVQTSSGGTAFKVLDGILSLALTKDAHPTPTNPVSFTITASLPNFAPIVQNVVITKNELSIFNVRALEYAKPASGTTVSRVSASIYQGIVTDSYTMTTVPTATMSEQASITFDAGTQLEDINGVALKGGTLNFNVVQFGTQNSASLQALPGGTVTAGVTKADGSIVNGNVNFVTAGLLQINLSADGLEVRKFSQPATLNIQVSSRMTNFSTGQPVKAGDTVPYWSLDETTGQWKNEGQTTLKADAGGKLYAVLKISHLSCWSVGWSWGAVGSYGTCGSSLNVIINTSDPKFKGGPYNVSLQTVDGTYLGGVQGVTISNGATVTLDNVPSIPQARIVVSGGMPNTSVQSSVFEPCSAGTVAVTVPVTQTSTINVAVDIVGLCNGQNVTILPSATFELYQQAGSGYTDAGTIQLINGKGSTGMQAGTSYYLTTTYNGTFYKCDPFSVSKADFPINSAGFNITARYDAAGNTLTFSGTIPVTCN